MVIGRKSPLGTWCSESETWTQAQLLVSKSPTLSSSRLWLETRTPRPTSEELAYLVKACSELIKFYHEFYHEGVTTQGDGKAHCKCVFQWPGFTDTLQNQHVPESSYHAAAPLSLRGRLRRIYNLSEAASFQRSVSEWPANNKALN